jgi:hypothetical protein
MALVIEATPECKEHLPSSASTFFQHFSSASSSSSSLSLQHTLSLLATKSEFMASLTRVQEMRKVDGGLSLAHLRSVSAKGAWAWKMVIPTTKELELTDTQYRIAVRLNLGLRPIMEGTVLPSTCPICKKLNTLRSDPWHFMTCRPLSKGEVTVRHDEVESALYRSALIMGFQAVRQPMGLDTSSDLRPDLMVILPGRRIVTDVAICHPLAPSRVEKVSSITALRTAREIEGGKRRKYLKMKTRHQMEVIPFVVETCGGMGPAAVKLLRAMAKASQEHLAMWPKQAILQHVVGSVAIAVQRGSAMAYLEGYDRALTTLERQSAEGEAEHEEEEEEENEVEEAEYGKVVQVVEEEAECGWLRAVGSSAA